MSNVREATAIDPAPTITVHISSLNGSALCRHGDLAGLRCRCLSSWKGSSEVPRRTTSYSPTRTVNGTRMQSHFSLAGRHTLTISISTPRSQEHSYHGELPKGWASYPSPIDTTLISKEHPPTTRVNTLEASPLVSPLPTSEDIMKEFPEIFNGQVKTMDGGEFHISRTMPSPSTPICRIRISWQT